MFLGPRCDVFLSFEWKMFSLCLDWTISISPSHPPAMQHCEEPGFAGSVFLLNSLPPPGYPCIWGEGSHCFPPAPGCASVGTAQHAVGFPCCLTFNLPKARSCVKLGLTFLSLRHPAARLLYHGKFIQGSQGYYWSLWHTGPRFQKAKGTEITHMKFLL